MASSASPGRRPSAPPGASSLARGVRSVFARIAHVRARQDPPCSPFGKGGVGTTARPIPILPPFRRGGGGGIPSEPCAVHGRTALDRGHGPEDVIVAGRGLVP